MECPKANLLMPSGIVQVEKPTPIVLRVVGDFRGSIEWKTSSGKILEGQGSPVVSFFAEEDDQGQKIQIVVTLQDLPLGCPREISDSLTVAPLPIGEPVDTLGKIKSGRQAKYDFLSRIDSYLFQLSESPSYEGLVELSFEATASRKHKIRHLKLILDQVLFRKMDPSRITFYISDEQPRESTTLWTAAPGARLPKHIRNWLTVKGEEFKRRTPILFVRTK